MTQVEKIEAYIDKYGEITQRDALGLGIYRLASRIHEMRKDTERPIITENRTVTNRDGSESVIAVYKWEYPKWIVKDDSFGFIKMKIYQCPNCLAEDAYDVISNHVIPKKCRACGKELRGERRVD